MTDIIRYDPEFVIKIGENKDLILNKSTIESLIHIKKKMFLCI